MRVVGIRPSWLALAILLTLASCLVPLTEAYSLREILQMNQPLDDLAVSDGGNEVYQNEQFHAPALPEVYLAEKRAGM